MRFGKIRVENNELRFTRIMKACIVPCEDIRWAYCQSGVSPETSRSGVVEILTRREKRYQFEMTKEEAEACVRYLKECNPGLIAGLPRGAPLPLRSVWNTRDLGGLSTRDGHQILPGQLLRSGELYHLSREDCRLLRDEYHLSAVVDFRTERERAGKPDTPVEGSAYIVHPIFDDEQLGISREENFLDSLSAMSGNAEAYMMTMYQNLVLDPMCQHQYARFFQMLVENEEGRAILWHCSVGKDRVGVATMLLLYALGVPRGAIFDDYMRTNICIEKDVEYLTRVMEWKHVPAETMRNVRMMLCARECYLQSAVQTIEAEYGSIERYLYRVMCLSARNLNKLRKRYLV